MAPALDDSDDWVSRIPSGDPEAFETMFREFDAPLRRFAHRHVRSHEAAAEIVQDVFYKLWTARNAFPGREQLRAFLFRATRNRALDYLEHEGVRRRWWEESLHRESMADTRRQAAPADEDAELTDLLETIEQVLAEMPERRAEVCRLRWDKGLTTAEIAERLAIAPKTVEVQIGRGLKQLRERLGRG